MKRFFVCMFVMFLLGMILMPTNVYAAVIQISTIEDLQKIGNYAGFPLYGEYELTQDIDASNTINWNNGAGFKPIGTSNAQFVGMIDGKEHKITGLYINRSDEGYIGLFGYIGSGGEVKNLGLENCRIIGSEYVGGLVGLNYKGSIESSYNTGAVSGSGNNVGGLVGSNGYYGSIKSSYWNIETAGVLFSAGGEWKTTEQMKQRATYVGWNFINIWTIIEGQTYPYFLWQSATSTLEGEGIHEGIHEGTAEGTHEGTTEGEGGGGGGCGCGGGKGIPSFDGFMKYLLDILFVGLLVSLMSGMKRRL
ncbi:MAG TPA: GLUG motif-containing protein [Candidatus Hydrogenedens sp.]|nr:GLUG motif-containing protein [Candidatus Hydrogenedens sp.]